MKIQLKDWKLLKTETPGKKFWRGRNDFENLLEEFTENKDSEEIKKMKKLLLENRLLELDKILFTTTYSEMRINRQGSSTEIC